MATARGLFMPKNTATAATLLKTWRNRAYWDSAEALERNLYGFRQF